MVLLLLVVAVVVIVVLQLLLLVVVSLAALFLLLLLLAPPVVRCAPLEDPAYSPYFSIMELNQLRGGESELVHHPVSLGSPAGTAAVVDERLLEPDAFTSTIVYWLVDAGGLPEARASDAVGPDAVPVLPATQAEEVAVLVSCALHHIPSFIWKIPGVMLVDINLPDDVNTEALLLHFPLQVESHELLIGWMEPEAREHQIILFVSVVCSATILLLGDPLRWLFLLLHVYLLERFFLACYELEVSRVRLLLTW